MSGQLLTKGDSAPHRHDLPKVPTETVRKWVGAWVTENYKQENAVAICGICGQLFVSREDPDGWGRVVVWVPLRWWHFRARRKLCL